MVPPDPSAGYHGSPMRVIAVPVKDLDRAKGRLAGVLSPMERAALTLGMLEDVLVACTQMPGWQTWVISPDPAVLQQAARMRARPVEEEDPGLVTAIRQVEEEAAGAEALAVVLGDLPFLTPEALLAALQTLIDTAGPNTRVAPGHGDIVNRAAIQAHEHGTPMLRTMLLEFPDDPTCAYLDLQYMLGDSLLVAPVFRHDGSLNYYVPEGMWTILLNGKRVEGPGWKRERHDFMSLPLLVRPNTVIPIGSHTDRPDYDYSDGVTLHIYALEDGYSTKIEIPSLDGSIESVFEIERRENSIHIQRRGPSKAWNVALLGATLTQVEKQVNEANIQMT